MPKRALHCAHSCWRCEACGEVLDLEEPLDCDNPLILSLGAVPDTTLSLRIQAFTYSRLVGNNVLCDAVGQARIACALCVEVLTRIGKPR